MKLGVFGGTFNPIHYGHLRVAEEARFGCGLDRILFIPCGAPSLKTTDVARAEDRYRMTCIATETNPYFAVSDIEMGVTSKAYTVNTVSRLIETHPNDELYLIMGIDVFLEMTEWREPERLTGLINFVVVTRPGFSVNDVIKSPFVSSCGKSGEGVFYLKGGKVLKTLNVTAFDIASSAIRRFIRQGISVKYLVPEAVERYIFEAGLYLE